MGAATAEAIRQTLVQIDPEEVRPYPNVNPRRRFDEEKQAQLEDSLEEEGGNIEPCVITDGPDEEDVGPRYWLVTGERRWRGCRARGLPLNAVYRPGLSYEKAVELAGIENLHRDDLTAIEEALWYQKLLDAGKSRSDVADIRGIDESTVSNTLRLLELPDEILELIDEGKLAPTNARDFLLPWLKEDEELRNRFFRTVRQQLDFGATTGQNMSKPWIKDMVERVGKIVKPEPEPEPEKKSSSKPAAKKKAEPRTKEPEDAGDDPETPEDAGDSAREPEEEAEAGSDEGRETPLPEDRESGTEFRPPAEASTSEKKDEPTLPAEPLEVDFALGVFGAAAQMLGGKIHHLTFAVFPHHDGDGKVHVTLTPKTQGGMPSGTGEVAAGTPEQITDEVRAAIERFVDAYNEGRK